MKNSFDGKTFDVFMPWSEMVDSGLRNEDGQRIIDKVWWIVGENQDGYRIRTIHTFRDEFEAESLSAIYNHLNVAGDLDTEMFEYIDPAYGSRAYVNEDIEYLRYLQERQQGEEER